MDNEQIQVTNQGGKGLSIAAMVIGIISLLLSCCYGGFLGIIGLILGIIALATAKPGKGMAIAGIVTSSIAIIITVVALILGASLISSLPEELNKLADEVTTETDESVTEETTEATTEATETNSEEVPADTEAVEDTGDEYEIPQNLSMDAIEIIDDFVFNNGEDTVMHFQIIKNVSDQVITILSNEQALLKDGTEQDAIGAVEGIGPGEEALVYNYYSGIKADDIASFKKSDSADDLYDIYVENSVDSLGSMLSVNYEVKGQDVTYTVTNNSEYEASVTLSLLFMKDGKPVYYINGTVVDMDNAEGNYNIRPGNTSSEITDTCPVGFDDVKMYYTGIHRKN